jgi:hypothetical protein
MFCPKCAAQNSDGTSFCRVCGANVSLVPQALSGQLPEAPVPEKGAACGKTATWESAFRSLFMGVAFLLIAVALGFSRMGGGWWFYMLIPASVLMATGVAHYMRMKELQKRQFQPGMMGQGTFQQSQPQSLPSRQTGELMAPPPSVTEGTTRHLGAEAATRHFGASKESAAK